MAQLVEKRDRDHCAMPSPTQNISKIVQGRGDKIRTNAFSNIILFQVPPAVAVVSQGTRARDD